MKYIVKEEYLDNWGSEYYPSMLIDETDVVRLASEWEMTVDELKEQLIEVSPARVSIDNGNRFYGPDELDQIWDEIESRNLYESLVYVMDDNIREWVVSEFWGESDMDFLQQYLETTCNDLVIG